MSKRQTILYLLFLVSPLGMLGQTAAEKNSVRLESNDFFDPTQTEKKKEVYEFAVQYRLEVGYVQNDQRTRNNTYPNLFLHGGKIGATVDFVLPKHFTLQTGLLYSLATGKTAQHWRSTNIEEVQKEYLTHRILEHNLIVPIRAYINIRLWKKLNMFFFTGPQLQLGLVQKDNISQHLSNSTLDWLNAQNVPTQSYDRLKEKELYRCNVQYGLGGGFEWDKYRLQSGYDFGLNNLLKKDVPSGNMSEWGWFVSFCYLF